MKKPVYSFRLDKDVMEKAANAGIDLPRFIEVTLQERLNIKKCPMCGQKRKVEK